MYWLHGVHVAGIIAEEKIAPAYGVAYNAKMGQLLFLMMIQMTPIPQLATAISQAVEVQLP